MKQKANPNLRQAYWLAALALGLAVSAKATDANFNNGSSDWNTGANWDTALVPGVGTNVNIGGGYLAFYSSPMSAASIYRLNLDGSLFIAASGFNIDGSANSTTGASGNESPINDNGFLSVTNGGVLYATNAGTLSITGTLSIDGGSALFDTLGTNSSPGYSVNLTSGALNVNSGYFGITNSGPFNQNNAAISVGGQLELISLTNIDGLGLTAQNSLTDYRGAITVHDNGSIIANRPVVLFNGASLTLTNNGIFSATNGNISLSTNCSSVIWPGATLAAKGILSVGQGNSKSTGGSFLTNNGGNINVGGLSVNNGNSSITCLAVINGGTNDLGAVNVLRCSASSVQTLGTEGLVIYNGIVRMTNLNVGNAGANSMLTFYLANGNVTNTGGLFVGQQTSGRVARFHQAGGFFSAPNATAQLGQTNAGQVVHYSVLGGTNIVQGFVFGGYPTGTVATTTVNFTNNSAIVVGSAGLVSNALTTANIALNSAGTFYASADWSSSVGIIANGGGFCAADLDGTAHNITLNNRIAAGTGGLPKTGAGSLILNATNTYTGDTLINAGSLVMGATGYSPSSAGFYTAAGAIYDVSASAYATNLFNSQKLGGKGTVVGEILARPGSAILPGGSYSTGKLTLANSLTLTNGATITLDLSSSPSSSDNDYLEINGNLNLAGANTIQITTYGVPANGTPYTVLHYSGAITGDPTTAFTLVGATGTISHNATAHTISITFFAGVRLPNSVTWAGNATSNWWDNTATTTNWLLSGALTPFVTGDVVTFDSSGAANNNIIVQASVNPSNMVVNAAANYTFSGPGSIDGLGGLTKNGAGTASMMLTNNYPGVTRINNGVLEVVRLAAGGSPSSIGVANADPTNLVFAGGTLRYSGASATTTRGATFTNANGNIDVSVAANTLTMSGTLDGNGGLTKLGDGMLTVNGANTFLGNVALAAGVLQTTSANGLGSVTNQWDLSAGTLILGVSGQPTWLNTINVISNSTLTCAGGNNHILNGVVTNSTPNVVLGLNIPSAGYFTFDRNYFTNFSGTFFLGNSQGTLRFNAGGNGTSTQQCGGSPFAGFDLGTNNAILVNRNGGGTSYGTYYLGSLAGGPYTQLRGAANGGSACTYIIGDRNNDSTFAGSIINGYAGGSSPSANAAVAITKTGTGTLTLSGTNTYSGSTVVNSGTLALSGYGVIRSSTSIYLNTGTTLDASARVDQSITLNTNQWLAGSATIKGSVVANGDGINGATLSPSTSTDIGEFGFLGQNSLGDLLITSNLVLKSGCSVCVDIYDGTTNDVFHVAGAVTLGGTLKIQSYANVVEGSAFKIFYAASYSGMMDAVTPTPSDTLAWDQSTLAIDGTLRATAYPRPMMHGISFTNGTLSFSAVNGFPNSSFTVVTSTNVAAPLSDTTAWTTLQVSGSEATGTFDGNGAATASFSITMDEAKRFYALKYTR
jgi:autotransporter-associated beta strand protein